MRIRDGKIRIREKHPGFATLVLCVHSSSLYCVLVPEENARGKVQGQRKSSLKKIPKLSIFDFVCVLCVSDPDSIWSVDPDSDPGGQK